MAIPSQDGFEDYRRDRNRRRAREGAVHRPTAPGSMDVLQQLERAEAAELQDQQLTREVQEFFKDATQTAASIMQKVSTEQETNQKERMGEEMEEFLMSTLQRLERFIGVIRHKTDGRQATAEIEAQMKNLVGPVLDQFRNEGTAQLADKHIGKDPFANELAEAEQQGPSDDPDAAPGAEFDLDGDGPSLSEFSPVKGTPEFPTLGEEEPAEDPKAIHKLEEDAADDGELHGHLISELHEEAVASRKSEPPAKPQTQAPAQPKAPAQAKAPRAADHPMLAALVGDPEKLKKALKVLVQNQLMTRDEALAIWRAENQG